MGRLTADPEHKQTPNGTGVTMFSVAVDRNYAPKDSERKTDFINVVAWRQTADFICRYFKKGSMIAIEGEINTRKYEDKSGITRTAVEVVAQHAYFAGAKSQQTESKPAPPDLSQFENIDLSFEEIDDPNLPF